MNTSPNAPIQAEEALAPLVDLAQVTDYLAFAKNAVRRHWRLSLATFIVTVSVTAVTLLLWPRSYHSEATLLTRRNDLMTSLMNPGRISRPEADDATRAASEVFENHDNLQAVIRETNLSDEWERTRTPLGRIKDKIFARLDRLRHRPAEDDRGREEVMLALLAERLVTNVQKDGVIKIAIDWPDPRLAAALVDAAIRQFIHARSVTEAAAMTDTITLLQQAAGSLQGDVARTTALMRNDQMAAASPAHALVAAALKPAGKRARRSAAVASTPAPSTTASATPSGESNAVGGQDVAMTIVELGRINSDLETAHQEIARLEGTQHQQTADIEAKLKTALTIYTNEHPTVVSLRESLATASAESPDLAALKHERQRLEAEYDALQNKARQDDTHRNAAGSADALQLDLLRQLAPAATLGFADDLRTAGLAATGQDGSRPDSSLANGRLLALQLTQLGNLLDRINGARLELATAAAGMKYRYVITRPADVPKAPSKPKVPAILAAGILGALFFAAAAAVATDLVDGRILEAWQVERQVGIPVLVVLDVAQIEQLGLAAQ